MKGLPLTLCMGVGILPGTHSPRSPFFQIIPYYQLIVNRRLIKARKNRALIMFPVFSYLICGRSLSPIPSGYT